MPPPPATFQMLCLVKDFLFWACNSLPTLAFLGLWCFVNRGERGICWEAKVPGNSSQPMSSGKYPHREAAHPKDPQWEPLPTHPVLVSLSSLSCIYASQPQLPGITFRKDLQNPSGEPRLDIKAQRCWLRNSLKLPIYRVVREQEFTPRRRHYRPRS